MWDKRMADKSEECVGEYIVACSFKNVEDGFDRNRRSLWEELIGLTSWWNLLWYIGGDSTSPGFLAKY
jgi:hypothetical protein